MDWIYKVLQKEDEFTNYICIGPVNKMINMLCVFIKEGKDSPQFKALRSLAAPPPPPPPLTTTTTTNTITIGLTARPGMVCSWSDVCT
jgi:hypothetical protein